MAARNQLLQAVEPDEEPEIVKTPTDDEILAIIRSEIAQSAGFSTSSRLMENRRQALRYYMGDPYGDEMEGRSQVVTSEFRDTIESLLPQLVKIFMGSDTVVQFEPQQPSDEEGAAQATETISYCFWKENPGFRILYTMIKDALMFKNGIVKVYWDEKRKVTTETYRGLTEEQRDAILQGEGVTPIAYTAYQGQTPGAPMPEGLFGPPQPATFCDLKIRRVDVKGVGRVENVPPEEFLISQRAASIQSARFCAHRTPKTVSDLVEMGVEKSVAESLGSAQSEGEFSLERQQRFVYDGDTAPIPDSMDKSTRPVWIYECYILLDLDGDGIAERWKITVGGDQYKILFKEEWEDEWPFESISPILMPHKFYGLSIYDLVQQWQRIQSTLVRQFLDNIYGINNNRIAVNTDRVNIDDLLTNRPNQVVRGTGNPNENFMPMVPTPLGGVLISAFEYFNSAREKGTGVTSYNQGLDANSLNKTASGISQIMGAAQERVLLIARIMADTGICGMFEQLLKLHCKHQNVPKTIRLRDKWVTVDPSAWNAGMNASTDVALGTNNRDQMLLHLNQVLQLQKEFVLGGKTNMVSDKNLYNTASKLIENTGLKHVESYFTDPSSGPPPPPPPNPEQIKQQATTQREQMGHMASLQQKQMDLEAEARGKMIDQQTELAKMRADQSEAEKERQNKLRIAREANMTALVTGGMKSQQTIITAGMKGEQDAAKLAAGEDGQSTAKPPTMKKKPLPIRFLMDRDQGNGLLTSITPVYEVIKEEADPEDAP